MDGKLRRDANQHVFYHARIKTNPCRVMVNICSGFVKQFARNFTINLNSDIPQNIQAGMVNDLNLIR